MHLSPALGTAKRLVLKISATGSDPMRSESRVASIPRDG